MQPDALVIDLRFRADQKTVTTGFALAELHQYVAAREHRLITDQLRATALLPCPYRVGTVEHLHAGIRTCCRTVQRTANLADFDHLIGSEQRPRPTAASGECQRCGGQRSDEHTSELPSLMRISSAV